MRRRCQRSAEKIRTRRACSRWRTNRNKMTKSPSSTVRDVDQPVRQSRSAKSIETRPVSSRARGIKDEEPPAPLKPGNGCSLDVWQLARHGKVDHTLWVDMSKTSTVARPSLTFGLKTSTFCSAAELFCQKTSEMIVVLSGICGLPKSEHVGWNYTPRTTNLDWKSGRNDTTRTSSAPPWSCGWAAGSRPRERRQLKPADPLYQTIIHARNNSFLERRETRFKLFAIAVPAWAD